MGDCCKSYKFLDNKVIFCNRKSKDNGYCGYHRNFEENEIKKLNEIEKNWICDSNLNNKEISVLFFNEFKKYISEKIIEKVKNNINKTSKTMQIIQESTENTQKTTEVKNSKKIKIKKEKRIKKSEIQEKLNSYGIFCKGNISVLKQKLDNIENIISTISHEPSKIILIQSKWRGYNVRQSIKLHGICTYSKYKCNNDSDFCTLDGYNDLDNKYFFSYKDIDNFYYWFDIRSLYKLFKMNKLHINPYTRNKFSDCDIKNIEYVINYYIKKGDTLEYEDNIELTKEQIYNQKVISTFQYIDELNYNTDIEWFNKLNLFQLKILYREIEDIWNYRAQLTDITRKNIVSSNKVFNLSYKVITSIKSIDKLRNILINDIKTMVTSGNTRDDCILGATYILSGLVLVSKKCAESYPFLLQQYVY